MTIDPQTLLLTHGASGALDLLCTLYTRPGDVIFVEQPTYFLALRIFADHGLRPVAVPVDDDGLDVDALEMQLKELRTAPPDQHPAPPDQYPAALYTIPTYQNPSGRTLSAERRRRLAELSVEYGFLLIADEVYHLLSYGDPPPPSMLACARRAGAERQTFSLGSFSKILAPGLRLGWIQAHPERVAELAGCGLLDSGGGLAPFGGALTRALVESGSLAENIAELRRVYAARVQALDAALRDPPAAGRIPQAGRRLLLLAAPARRGHSRPAPARPCPRRRFPPRCPFFSRREQPARLPADRLLVLRRGRVEGGGKEARGSRECGVRSTENVPMNAIAAPALTSSRAGDRPAPSSVRLLLHRPLLFTAFQAGIALIFVVLGEASPWQASTAWWPLTVAAADALTLLWLLRLRIDGRSYRQLIAIDRSSLGRDLLYTLGVAAVGLPLAFAGQMLAEILLFGDPQASLPLMFRPLPAWAFGLGLVLFPLGQGLAELPNYFAFAMPALRGRFGRLNAWLIASLFLSLQHVAVPLVIDGRFIAYRAVMFLPFALWTGFAIDRRPRLLAYLIVVHWLIDLLAALMVPVG